MQSQPLNPAFRNIPETFKHCGIYQRDSRTTLTSVTLALAISLIPPSKLSSTFSFLAAGSPPASSLK